MIEAEVRVQIRVAAVHWQCVRQGWWAALHDIDIGQPDHSLCVTALLLCATAAPLGMRRSVDFNGRL
ncbi:hypothetical protein AO262_30225 [Pseudomonas fluorescens ABAC62]|nr:hypothetical protein AO262_30225 [Pseudomonas fluorescens ABAC62]